MPGQILPGPREGEREHTHTRQRGGGKRARARYGERGGDRQREGAKERQRTSGDGAALPKEGGGTPKVGQVEHLPWAQFHTILVQV